MSVKKPSRSLKIPKIEEYIKKLQNHYEGSTLHNEEEINEALYKTLKLSIATNRSRGMPDLIHF